MMVIFRTLKKKIISPFILKEINLFVLFDDHFLIEKLAKLKDSQVKLEAHIEWKISALPFDVVFNKSQNSSNTGRPPLDCIPCSKSFILQRQYNLSNDQIEYHINDRLSIKHFLGLKSSNKVHDSKTILKLRETIIQEEVIGALLYRFKRALDNQCKKVSNRLKSKSIARVVHIFSLMTNSMEAIHVPMIGIFSADAKIGFTNLTYNMMHCVQLNKKINTITIMG